MKLIFQCINFVYKSIGLNKIKDGYEKIAVICGAWHGPALQDLARFKQSKDNALLRGRKKINDAGGGREWAIGP